MKPIQILPLLLLYLPLSAAAGPLINEISAGGNSDWIEITLSPDTESCDISRFLVTMYYGTNEALSATPVTLKNRNLPETPYDDRYAVVHFSSVPFEDETDITGDTNKNGMIDIYCCNYGLWNTDCVVSIDDDDLPSNGGILDFTAFSNRDGSINSTIGGYINGAVAAGQWEVCSSTNIQECAVDIGIDGLVSYSTISRVKDIDTNSMNDFAVTPYATPGRENIIIAEKGRKKLFRTLSKDTSHRYGKGSIKIPLFIYETCSVKIRIFTSTGFTVYSSLLNEDLNPGYLTLDIPESKLHGKINTGLYPVQIEASGKNSVTENSMIFLVIKRNKK